MAATKQPDDVPAPAPAPAPPAPAPAPPALAPRTAARATPRLAVARHASRATGVGRRVRGVVLLYETSYDATVNATGAVVHRHFAFRGRAGAGAAPRRDRTSRTRLQGVYVLAPGYENLPPMRFLPAASATTMPVKIISLNIVQPIGVRVWAFWDAENAAGYTWPVGFYTAVVLLHFF